MDDVRESLGELTSVIRVAVRSDDSAQLIAAASMVARQPVALVGHDGEPLGYAPDGGEGRRALAVATAASRSRLVGAAGWRIVPITRGRAALGFLVIGDGRRRNGAVEALLDVLPDLIAEQQHRLAVLRSRGATFVRHLASDARFGQRDARVEAAELGLGLAAAYWPAIVAWHDHMPPRTVVTRLMRDALAHAEGSLGAVLGQGLVLLHPDRPVEPVEWLEPIVARARKLAPSFPVQAIAAEAPVELAGVATAVAELDALWRTGPRRREETPVALARDYAVERLLWEHVDAAAARRFVDDQLGPLIAWDREHGTDLLSVLEAALEHPRHDVAARRCFMHRNTFRHRLQQAGEVLGTALEDSNVRLATHVALKLRGLMAASSPVDGARGGELSGGPRRSRRRSPGPLSARALRSRGG